MFRTFITIYDRKREFKKQRSELKKQRSELYLKMETKVKQVIVTATNKNISRLVRDFRIWSLYTDLKDISSQLDRTKEELIQLDKGIIENKSTKKNPKNQNHTLKTHFGYLYSLFI